jgi:polyhydroxyalkanoate synthesis regulator phasin
VNDNELNEFTTIEKSRLNSMTAELLALRERVARLEAAARHNEKMAQTEKVKRLAAEERVRQLEAAVREREG